MSAPTTLPAPAPLLPVLACPYCGWDVPAKRRYWSVTDETREARYEGTCVNCCLPSNYNAAGPIPREFPCDHRVTQATAADRSLLRSLRVDFRQLAKLAGPEVHRQTVSNWVTKGVHPYKAILIERALLHLARAATSPVLTNDNLFEGSQCST